MIRLGTILWLAFALTAGVGLFQVKYEVQALEEELTRLHQQIVREREAIHVLRAEWSYLNEPGRLAALARRHLDMAPLTPAQLGRLDGLPERLPVAPAAPDGDANPDLHRPAATPAALVASATRRVKQP